MASSVIKRYLKGFSKVLLLLILFVFTTSTCFASELDDKRAELDKIEHQIYEINKNLESIQGQRKTLESQIAAMNQQIKATELQIKATQEKIEIIGLEINDIQKAINQKEEEIKYQERILADSLQVLYERGEIGILEILVSYNNFSDFLAEMEYLSSLEMEVMQTSKEIGLLKTELEAKKKELVDKKENLEDLKAEQEDEKIAYQAQKNDKETLLTKTKGKESIYQRQLSTAQAQKKKVFSELIALEPKYGGSEHYTGNKDGRYYGYFTWPLKNYVITQGYGMTDFAKSGFYGGLGHNGIDICSYHKAPIKAAAPGQILRGTHKGWGNWVAIKHPNGLTTLYAHLNSFAVFSGQYVERGKVIGYQGTTGASTGSHLHFSVYWNFYTFSSPGYGYGPAYNYEGTLNPFSVLP